MRKFLVFVLVFASFAVPDAAAQRRSKGRPATATFAVAVSDPAGSPLGNVLVTLEGPAKRSARTEAGRIVFENLPSGAYVLRFERQGYVTVERELTAKAGAPIDVKVTLNPLPKPVAPPPPVPPPPAAAKPVVIDVPGFIEKNYINRDPRKISPLGCAAAGATTLIQLNAPLEEHEHADSDEFVYVIAGEGILTLGGAKGTPQHVNAGVFVLVPRGTAHSITPTGRKPLVALSTRAGEGCAAQKP